MNLNDFEILVHKREGFGTTAARRMRSQGKVPANFYGKSAEFSGWIDLAELKKAISSKTLFNKFTKVNFDGKQYTVFAKVIQKDSVTENILHIDFQVVSEGQKIEMKVPLVFTDADKCEDIKLGGILNPIMSYIPLVGTPENMPYKLEYSLKGAKTKTSLKLEDIKFPEGVKVSSKVTTGTVATILASRKKAVAAAASTTE